MAPPSLLQWSQKPDLNAPPPDLTPEDTKPAIDHPAAPKPKRVSKAAAAAAAAAAASAKKTPQRGPGVAQLERIRLLERLNKLPSSSSAPAAEGGMQYFPVSIPSVYDLPTVRYYGGGPGTQFCYVPAAGAQYGCVQGVYPSSPVTMRSVVHEQYVADRVLLGMPAAGSWVPELPSSQKAAPSRCSLFENCDFCLKNQLTVSESSLGLRAGAGGSCTSGHNHRFSPNLYPEEKEIRQYEFFPHGGGMELGDRRAAGVGAAAASSSSSPAAAASLVDLSLKLY